MERHLRSFYFVIVKFVGILSLVIWGITQSPESTAVARGEFVVTALFLLSTVLPDIDTKPILIWYFGAGILAVIAVFLFPVIGIYFVCIVFLDIVSGMSVTFYLGSYLIVMVAYWLKLNVGLSFLITSFLFLLYLQNYKIIGWYKKIVGENIETESQLKSDMEHSNVAHKNEMRESRLRFDNELLEEKARISQALHDKL